MMGAAHFIHDPEAAGMPGGEAPMIRLSRATLVGALLPLLFPSLSHAQAVLQAQAVPDPVVRLTSRQAASFGSAFTALSQQARVAVMAEDEPLRPTLTPQLVTKLGLKGEGEPLSTLLPKLAAAYDYDVQPSGPQPSGKVFLLKKRYTDAADLPSITVKEFALGLEEASRYAEGFNPHIPLEKIGGTSVISDLVYSLTPEQLEAMGDDKRGVPVASLSPIQQQEVQQLVLHFYVQRAVKDLPTLLRAVNWVAAGDPKFGRHFFPIMNARLFGFDAPFGYEGFLPLSRPDLVTVNVGYSLGISLQPAGGAPPADPTDPPPVPANAPPPALPVSSSLADILTQLNAHADDGLKVTVEPYLAPKRVTVFGEAAVTPRQEVAALAEVYGLRVFKDDPVEGHDHLRLTRQTAQVPLTLLSLHDSILQALPDPLVRAYRKHDRSSFSTGLGTMPGVPARFLAAARQVRAAAEPKLRGSGDKAGDKDERVALSALPERAGRAMAVLMTLEAMDALYHWVAADPPVVITRFDELRLGGGLSGEGSQKQLDLALELPIKKGSATLDTIAAVGGLHYDPVNHTL